MVNKAVELLKSIKNCYSIRGNHDRWYIKAINDKNLKKVLAKKFSGSYNFLSERVVKILCTIPDYLELNIAKKDIGIFHNRPNTQLSDSDRIYPDTEIIAEEFSKYDIVFLGHSHYRMVKKIGKTLIINPGSLGCPRNGEGNSYAIFDFNKEKIEFFDI